MLKNKFLLSAGIFVFVFALFSFVSVGKVQAANSCVANASGNWSDSTKWNTCGGTTPQSGDSVTIPTAITMTLDTSASVNSLSISDPVNASNGITFSSNNSLTVATGVTLVGSSGTGTSTLAVGAGALIISGGNLSIVGGGSSGNSIVSVSTGTINVSGSIPLTGTTARAQLTSTGAGTIGLGGDLTGGTLITSGTGTINFFGSGAEAVGAYTTYNNVLISKTGGTATMSGTTTIGGTLTINGQTLETSSSVLTVTGATTIGAGGTLSFNNASGLKTFTGDVTINGGWSEGAAVAITFAGNVTNNTLGTVSTGVHTFSGSGKTLSGSVTTTIPSVSISGNTSVSGTLIVPTLLSVSSFTTLTNNGTVTASSNLTGTGTFVNSTGATLNIGTTPAITTLTATATGNTVNYNRPGDQTIMATPYYNLTLSGIGVKTVSSPTVSGTFTIMIGENNYIVTSGSPITSANISPTAAGLLIPSGTFILTSPNGYPLNSFDGVVTAPQTCVPSQFDSFVTITGTGSTFAINPDTTHTCYVTGGGGGQLYNGSPTPPTTTTTTVSTTTPTTTTPTTSPVLGNGPMVPAGSSTIPGCTSGDGFSVTNGQACHGSTMVPVTTPSASMMMTVPKNVTSKSPKASIQVLQSDLNTVLGSKLSTALVVDGKWGTKTTAAVKMFQTWVKITADGRVGPITSGQLNTTIGAQ